MWPSWKLPKLTSEILNQLHNECKQSRTITMNVNPGGNDGSGTAETLSFGVKKLKSSLRKLLHVRISVFVMRFVKTKVWNRIGEHMLMTVY